MRRGGWHRPKVVERETIGEDLARWGKVALLETRGRRSGAPVRAAVGFVEQPDGTLLVAAGEETADWVRNLRAYPRCRVTVGERTAGYAAEVMDEGPERSAAITALILRYGTPAERLGNGPVFRLVPAEAGLEAEDDRLRSQPE
jgi:deazaflavin-dependent oxidoreductase (nitroreductase family)